MYADSLPFLQNLNRVFRAQVLKQVPEEKTEVTALFPQLVAMHVRDRVVRPVPGMPTSRFEVFQPMSVQAIHHLYGINYRIRSVQDPCYHKFMCIFDVLDDVMQVRFRQDAYLLDSDIKACMHSKQLWSR